MNRRLVFFDCETTGTSPETDRIVELAMQWDRGDGVDGLVSRVNPGVPIPAAATEVHGITDADVASAPRFADIAERVQAVASDAVLVGYNCRTFDTPLLDAELRRAWQPGLARDSAGRIIAPEIDLLQLWWRHEDRKLVTAARRFAGVDLTDAHAADADTRVLPDILNGMCGAFGLDGADTDRLCTLSIPDGAIDRDGKFRRREDGVICFAFGKHAGQSVAEHLDFVRWMLSKDFSAETKGVARALMARSERRSA